MEVDLHTFIIIPALIFLSRVADVSLGTLRFIFLGRGYRKQAACLGFFEVLIWVAAMGEVMGNLNNPVCYVAYAGGFAAGNYAGIWLEEKLRVGTVLLRIVFKQEFSEFTEFLRFRNFGYTLVDGTGTRDHVKMAFCVTKRKHLEEILNMLHTTNPRSFFTIENVRSANEGIFPIIQKTPFQTPFRLLFRKHRKSK